MENQGKFQEMLRDILEVARVQGNQLGISEIKNMFGDMNLNESQYEHIFAYLAANHIKIKGYVETTNEYVNAVKEDALREEFTKEQEETKASEQPNSKTEYDQSSDNSDKTSAYLKMYLEDISVIKKADLGEEDKLVSLIKKGDSTAKSRFIEINLEKVVKIAKEFSDKGVTIEDLIQEGNIGLMCTVEEIASADYVGSISEFIENGIKKAMEQAIEELSEDKDFEKRIMDKITILQQASKELEEELGREANIHELAGYLNMPEDEIIDVLKMSADAVKLDKKHK